MNKKTRNFSNNALWWLDFAIINNMFVFKYSKYNDIFFLNLNYNFLFFILNKYNINNLFFYIVDSTIINNNYFLSYQSFFFDFKILISSKITNKVESLSNVYKGLSWVERENKEFNKINFLNLQDTRKLLSNYNYNDYNNYNNYNNIINDIQI
jgi:hypothetical protein